MMATPTTVSAQASDPYIGQMMLVGFGYCPNGWLEANGQILQIQQYTALFALFGPTYGGDGRQTFALPDLRGRTVVHTGNPPFGGSYPLGQVGGNNTVTLNTSQLPAHNHSLNATTAAPNTDNPTNSILADFPDGNTIYNNSAAPNTTMSPQAIGPTGSNAPVPVRDPYLVMRWCVSMTGVFPPRPN